MRFAIGLSILGLAVGGCGGGSDGAAPAVPAASANSAATPTATPSPTPGPSPSSAAVAPKLVQMNTFQTANTDDATNTAVQFKSLTTAGDTLWVAVTVSDYGGIHTIAVTDTQGNAYTLLDQQNDGAPGSQTVAHFYAANIAGDTATPDVVTVTWSFDNYKGVLITEISGVTQSPLVGHASKIQDGLAAGSNNVSSGPIAVGAAQTPGLLVALSMNTSGGTSDIGGSGATGPAAGSGLTPVATLWDWGVNLATFATGTVSTAESVSSVFNAPDVDSYVTVAAVFH